MKSSLVYIITFMPSFVKNEIAALRKKGINVKVVMLGQPEAPGRKGWSYICGGLYDPIYIPDQNKLFKRLFIFTTNLINMFFRAKGKNILSVFKMIFHSSYSRSLALYHVRRALDVYATIVKSGPYRIHSHFAWGNAFVAAYTAQLLGIAFSLTVHADDIFGLSEKKERELKWLLSRADKVITISNFNRTYLVEKGICAEEKIEVIHCGIPLNKFLLDEHAYQEGLFRIVTVPSGFVEKKGLDLLLKAVRHLLEQHANIELIIVGPQCNERNKYEQVIIESGMASIVKFTGAIPQKDLPGLYKNCHAFVLPCIVDSKGRMDGIPVSLMEAMAVGIPVVSTAISGIPELIEHEKEGLLAKPRDVVSLYTQLMRLIGEANRAIVLAKAARLKIELEFNIEVIAQKLIASLALRELRIE